MTALSHLDPSFGSVFAIEAVNEPIMDATQTPGYGDCKSSWRLDAVYMILIPHPSSLAVQKNFVQVIRAVELILGIPIPGLSLDVQLHTSNFTSAITAAVSGSNIFNSEVKSALTEAVPILVELGFELAISSIFNFNSASSPLRNTRQPLVAKSVAFLSRIDENSHARPALWTSTGSSTTLPTRRTRRSGRKDMTTTCTTASA